VSILELVLLAAVGFFGGYGLATWHNDAEKRRNRGRTDWLRRYDEAAQRKRDIR
jgi:hypothetical protein